MNQMLLEIVAMVRGEVKKIDRITLGVLVTIEVHAKDVVEELMKHNVQDINAFEWLA